MKAFMTSIVALVVITAAAAFGIGSMLSQSSEQAYTVNSNVRN